MCWPLQLLLLIVFDSTFAAIKYSISQVPVWSFNPAENREKYLTQRNGQVMAGQIHPSPMHHLSALCVCLDDPAHETLKGFDFLHPLFSLDQSPLPSAVLYVLRLLYCPDTWAAPHRGRTGDLSLSQVPRAAKCCFVEVLAQLSHGYKGLCFPSPTARTLHSLKKKFTLKKCFCVLRC